MAVFDVPPNPHRSADHRQLRIDLAQLGTNAQCALDLVYRERLSQPQIAVRMSLTEPAVRRLISTALQDLGHIIVCSEPPTVAAPAA
jgi:DNA-directed RNA polymerase specialized sigma24 family protein